MAYSESDLMTRGTEVIGVVSSARMMAWIDMNQRKPSLRDQTYNQFGTIVSLTARAALAEVPTSRQHKWKVSLRERKAHTEGHSNPTIRQCLQQTQVVHFPNTHHQCTQHPQPSQSLTVPPQHAT